MMIHDISQNIARRGMTLALNELDDDELAEEARAREIAFQEVLAEVARRAGKAARTDGWSERGVAACLAAKRKDVRYFNMECEPTKLPPPLFRMGYEWAALSIASMLEGILARPSDDIGMSQEFKCVGNGLYKPEGEPKIFDYRRRAALDLIKLIDDYGKSIQRGMFYVLPARKAEYDPSDDERLELTPDKINSRLAGGLFVASSA